MSTDEERDFEVEMHGDVREVYAVRARSAEEAREKWATGDLVLSEASSMGFYSVQAVS